MSNQGHTSTCEGLNGEDGIAVMPGEVVCGGECWEDEYEALRVRALDRNLNPGARIFDAARRENLNLFGGPAAPVYDVTDRTGFAWTLYDPSPNVVPNVALRDTTLHLGVGVRTRMTVGRMTVGRVGFWDVFVEAEAETEQQWRVRDLFTYSAAEESPFVVLRAAANFFLAARFGALSRGW